MLIGLNPNKERRVYLMPILTIKMKDGEVYQARVPMHFMVVEQYGVKINDVVDTGFITKGREVWMDRKPH